MRAAAITTLAFLAMLTGWHAHAASFRPYTPDTYTSAVASGSPVLVHVHADWCSVCQRQVGILDEILGEPAFKDLQAIRINFDIDREIVQRLGVRAQSTVLVVVDGKVTSASHYETNPATLRQQILSGL